MIIPIRDRERAAVLGDVKAHTLERCALVDVYRVPAIPTETSRTAAEPRTLMPKHIQMVKTTALGGAG